MLALRVLGGFQVFVDGREVAGLTAQPSRAALLVFLAMEGSTTRDAAIALLWPEHDSQRARHTLSQTLSRLRGALGQDWLQTDGERIAITPSLTLDARGFEALVEAGEHDQAIALYRGPFLTGWFLGESPAFELWADSQRARLERLHRRARRESIRQLRERGDLSGALAAAQQWAEIDPLEDEAQHGFIALLAESGRRTDALRQFELYRKLLAEEDLGPLDETLALVARLRQAVEQTPRAAVLASGARVPAAPSLPPLPARAATGVGNARRQGWRAAIVRLLRGRRHIPGVRPRIWPRLGTVLGALVLVAMGVLLTRGLTSEARARRAALPPDGRILLADFGNDTRDSLISGVVTEALRIDLARRLHSALVDPAEIGRVLRRMQRDPGPPLTGETAREVAERAGIPALIDGKVGAVGPGFVLSAWIVATSDGRMLEAVLSTARDSTELIAAIEKLSLDLGAKIRPSLARLPPPAPLARVTTTSLEALRNYTAGTRVWRLQGDSGRALRLLDEAVALDSTFAMAHRARALVRMNLGAPRKAWVPSLESAYRHRDRLEEPERGLTAAAYYHMATWEVDEARRAYEGVLERDSLEVTALNNLAVIYMGLRDFARAEAMLRRCLAADSLVVMCLGNLGETVHARGRYAEARAIAARAARIFPGHPLTRALPARMAAAELNYDTADSLFAEVLRKYPPDPGAYSALALLDAPRGRLRDARSHLDQAYRVAGREQPLRAFTARYLNAWIDLGIRRDSARALAAMDAALREAALLAGDSADLPYLELAEFYLTAGRPERADAALRGFLANVPVELRRAQDRRLYSVRGLMAMRRGRFEEALEAFRIADTRTGTPFDVLQHLGPLYESTGRPDSAIVAYERYLAVGAIERLHFDAVLLPSVLERLGALHEARGHRAAAARYYTRLADLWAGADPELQPRARAARERARTLLASVSAPVAR